MRSFVYEASNGDMVLVTIYGEEDRIDGEAVDDTPEVAIRPDGARSWGPPLTHLRTETRLPPLRREA